jgi:hypothetical protein
MANPGGTPANLLKGGYHAGINGKPKGAKSRWSRERWEQEVQWLAGSNLINAFEGVHGNRRTFTLRELRAMPESMQRCISSVKVRTENLSSGDGKQDITVEIKLWDKTRALELGARANGWLKDNVTVSISEDTLARLDEWKAANRRDTIDTTAIAAIESANDSDSQVGPPMAGSSLLAGQSHDDDPA